MFPGQPSKSFGIRVATLSLLCATALAISGCGTAASVPSAAAAIKLQGSVHGGQQPVSLSNINLYSADVAGGFVSRLTLPVLSGIDGQFSITADYTCPSPTTPMFITATDGNPGLLSGTDNTALSLAAAIGDCGTLSSSTYITIDEVTTAAFAAEYNAITTAGTSALLEAAFTRATNFADFATGTSPGSGQSSTSDGGTIPVDEINTLANIIATCVNSNGSTTSTDPCGELFSYTGSPANTLDALTNLEGSPSTYALGGPDATAGDTYSLYGLASSTGPFQPTLSNAPPTWAVTAEQAAVTPTLHVTPYDADTTGVMTAIPSAGTVGDTVVITSNPPNCPISPPLTIAFGGQQSEGSFNSSEATVTVPSGAASGGELVTATSDCTFPFTVQSGPAYLINPATLAFGTQTTGTESSSITLTFTNNKGPATESVDGPPTSVLVGGFTISSTPATNFKTTADECTGVTVFYSNTCTVSLAFAPGVAGASSGTITFYIDGVNVTATAALSGTGN